MSKTFSITIQTDRRAVTPVLGGILIVALGFVLSAAVGTFALGVSDTNHVGGQYGFSSAAGESLSVSVDAASNVEPLTVLVDDHTVRTVDGLSAGDVLTVTNVPPGATVRLVEERPESTRVVFEHVARNGFGVADAVTDAVVTLSTDALAVVSPFSCAGADICVATDESGDFTTVTDALAAAEDGEVVFVAAGTYAPKTVPVHADVTVVGEAGTVLDGVLFVVVDGAELELRDLTIRHDGISTLVYESGDLTLEAVTFETPAGVEFERTDAVALKLTTPTFTLIDQTGKPIGPR